MVDIAMFILTCDLHFIADLARGSILPGLRANITPRFSARR